MRPLYSTLAIEPAKQADSKAKEEYEIASGVKGTKNVPIKPKEKKFEDTGDVKKNIANLFLPKSRRKK